MARGFDDQPLHRENFRAAIAALQRRKDRLIGAYNLQSVMDTESGLIVDHDIYNDANDSYLLRPMATATKKVLEVDQIQVLTDGGYSNAEEIGRCEQDAIVVVAPIKRGAMRGARGPRRGDRRSRYMELALAPAQTRRVAELEAGFLAKRRRVIRV